MSRSGYSENIDDNWQHIMWRGQVASATRGKRGQKLLRDLATAMDAMPRKRLIRHELKNTDGEYCALGAVAALRDVKLPKVDPDFPVESTGSVADVLDIAEPLAKEIVYMNDEYFNQCSPEELWEHMRAWVQDQLPKETK